MHKIDGVKKKLKRGGGRGRKKERIGRKLNYKIYWKIT